jgi:hypothetical protein
MREKRILVSDPLLRKLSQETRRIGSKVLVRSAKGMPAYMADITDVIIMPHTAFYRDKFMEYYRACQHNAVKALKELANKFPFIPDYGLGLAYVLNVSEGDDPQDHGQMIRIQSELEFSTGRTLQQELTSQVPVS